MGYEIIDDEKECFTRLFRGIAKKVHRNAVEKGFWDVPKGEGHILMLMVTELAEAFEAIRNGDVKDDHIPEFRGIEAELADVIIRIMDFSEGQCLRVAEAIVAKIEYNKTRPFMHGKQF